MESVRFVKSIGPVLGDIWLPLLLLVKVLEALVKVLDACPELLQQRGYSK